MAEGDAETAAAIEARLAELGEGPVSVEQVIRAIEALGLSVPPPDVVAAMIAKANDIAGEVEWTMALEAQNLPESAALALRLRVLATQLADYS